MPKRTIQVMVLAVSLLVGGYAGWLRYLSKRDAMGQLLFDYPFLPGACAAAKKHATLVGQTQPEGGEMNGRGQWPGPPGFDERGTKTKSTYVFRCFRRNRTERVQFFYGPGDLASPAEGKFEDRYFELELKLLHELDPLAAVQIEAEAERQSREASR